MAKVVVNVRVEQLELDAWKVRAGALGMNLSDWIRSRCEDPGRVLESPPLTDSPVGRIVYESERPRAKRTEMCGHRRRPDEFCVKCD